MPDFEPSHLPTRQALQEFAQTDDPDVALFYDELCTLDSIYDGKLPFTIRHIAHAIVPDSLDETVVDREARVFAMVKVLGEIGLMSPIEGRESKIRTDGDWLPAYQLYQTDSSEE